jgi:hypothetical protein
MESITKKEWKKKLYYVVLRVVELEKLFNNDDS